MTLHEFSVLTDRQKAPLVWAGKFIAYKEEKGFAIVLYQVHDFYVEAYYDSESNEIIRFHPLSPQERVEMHFAVSLN